MNNFILFNKKKKLFPINNVDKRKMKSIESFKTVGNILSKQF